MADPGGGALRVTFHGVRGSFPSLVEGSRRYGGNTSSVSLRLGDEPPLLLDLGTGVVHAPVDGALRATVLVTHLHFDHVQGLPFFPPVRRRATELDVYGPPQQSGSLRDAFARLVRPPYFPLSLDELPCTLRFHDAPRGELAVGTARVMARPVPHRGPTVGYRVDWGGASVAYVSDHQAPATLDGVDPGVLELCAGVDLLVHEAQFTPSEFERKPEWGHCTPGYALLVAAEAGARRLCLFHHDPSRTDEDLDALVADVRRAAAGTAVEEVTAAAEGTTIVLEASSQP